MLEFYPAVRLFHISFALMSGSLFLVRGLLRLRGFPQYRHVVLRWLSYAIDTALLTAALMLMTMLHQYPIAQPWLTAKLACVIAYVAVGYYAFRPGTHPFRATVAFMVALLLFLFIISIARAHDPLGIVHLLIDSGQGGAGR